MTQSITAAQLIERYDGFLLDAYGVLVTSGGPVSGANSFLAAIREAGKPYVILTNDSSRLPESAKDAYLARGVDIGDAPVVTSGSLLDGYVERHGLAGQKCFVLGPPDSHTYAERAGMELVSAGEDAELVVIGDQSGFDFLPTVDDTLTMIVRRLSAGDSIRLALPNPDRIYPKSSGAFGVASGAIAAMFEASLEASFGNDGPTFDRLGKPYPPIFRRAIERLGEVSRDRTVMVGDQLETDIRGANGVGIDSALAATGVARGVGGDVRPTWLLEAFVS